ncbi:MAG: hypothetical protein IJ021_09030, partial [Clostridia bacterium]|nr:hypothetical protein [Clostridia bacterium]
QHYRKTSRCRRTHNENKLKKAPCGVLFCSLKGTKIVLKRFLKLLYSRFSLFERKGAAKEAKKRAVLSLVRKNLSCANSVANN